MARPQAGHDLACHLFLTAVPILQMRQVKLMEAYTAGKREGGCDPSLDLHCQTTEPELDLQPREQL